MQPDTVRPLTNRRTRVEPLVAAPREKIESLSSPIPGRIQIDAESEESDDEEEEKAERRDSSDLKTTKIWWKCSSVISSRRVEHPLVGHRDSRRG